MKQMLIADDDKEYLSILSSIMSDYCKIDCVYNVKDEIEFAKKHKYSLILTDNDMGESQTEKGLYAISEIRKFDKSTPIIMSSGCINDLVEQAKLNGANEVWKKPLDFRKLRDYLQKNCN